jgi:hypothetical protein
MVDDRDLALVGGPLDERAADEQDEEREDHHVRRER